MESFPTLQYFDLPEFKPPSHMMSTAGAQASFTKYVTRLKQLEDYA